MEQYTTKHNNWNYKISLDDKPNIPFSLEIKPFKEPKSLSKYYSLNEDNIKAFLHNNFYLSQPNQLNDLFDSNPILINFEDRPFDHFISYINSDKIALAKQEYSKNPKLFLDNIKAHIYQEWITITGILCMTENKTNDLMWTHYTNNYGFLVEFDYSKFNPKLFMGPYPINYSNKLTPVLFKNTQNTLGFLIASTIKKKIWDYENEYRFFCRPENGIGFKVSGPLDNSNFHSDLQPRFISYPKESIKNVILGFAFFKNDIDRQNANYSDYKYNVIFTRDNSELKIKLFNYTIENNINVELLTFDSSFKLIPIPINITKRNETTYYIEEQRPQVKTK